MSVSERKCRDVTESFYPNKVSAAEFIEILDQNKEAFIKNMSSLDIGERWPEDWIETFAAWLDIER